MLKNMINVLVGVRQKRESNFDTRRITLMRVDCIRCIYEIAVFYIKKGYQKKKKKKF